MADQFAIKAIQLHHDGGVVHMGQVQRAVDDLAYQTNTALNTLSSGGTAPAGPAGGDLSGTFPNPTVAKASNNFAVTGQLTTTGNTNVAGTLSSASNTNPAGPTNSGVALGAAPNYAFIGLYDQTQSANNRSSQILFLTGQTQFRLANDASSSTVNWLVASGGQASGVTGITSNSGSGSWTHTGNLISTATVQGFTVAANGGSLYAGGAPSTPLNVTTASSVQAFIGGAANQATVAYINSTNTPNNRSAYSQWAGATFAIAAFANDAFNAGLPIIQASGGYASGITAIASNSGTGAWTHTGAFTASGTVTASGNLIVNGNATINEGALTSFTGTGGVTLNAAAIATVNTPYVIRSGATANFTDTTDVAGNLIASFPGGAPVGFVWTIWYANQSSFTATIAGGSGVTMSGIAQISGGSWRIFVAKVTAAGAVTLTSVGAGGL